MQALPTHVLPVAHALPQPPQLPLSDVVSTHAPPHAVKPLPQPALQVPALHTSVAPHAVPQIPQFFGSDDVSTPVPLHTTCPAAHCHGDPTHLSPPLHTVPHLPQFPIS